MSTTTGDTVKFAGTDVQTLADIADMSGILSNGPIRGNLIVKDWTAGATWIPGPPDSYVMPLPLVMKSNTDEGVALGQLRDVVALATPGTPFTLTRVVMDGATQVTETCTAVVFDAIDTEWSFEERNLVGCTLLLRNLSGVWT